MTRTDPPVVTAGPDKITVAIDHDRTDRTTLERAEATIRRGLLDAARGLGDIRDGRLYKAAGFTSFDTYTRDRLGMSRDRADQIIAAGSVVAELPTIVGSQVKEGHVRALRAVADDADIVQDILTEVMEENGGKITAKAITAKIAQRRADDDRRAMLVALLGPGAGSLAVAGLLSDAHVQQLQRLAGRARALRRLARRGRRLMSGPTRRSADRGMVDAPKINRPGGEPIDAKVSDPRGVWRRAGDTARRTSYWGIAPQWDDTELSLAYPSCMVADLMKAPR